MRLPIGTEIGKYVLEERRGSGSFGTVYRATDRATNSTCALKCIEVDPTTDVRLILLEARNLKACQSQHIVAISAADIVMIGGARAVAIDMEYLPDGSLADRIERQGITYDAALTATRHLLLGLSAAHNAGIIHKDVKPANLMIDGHVFKLSDFGISYIKATAVGVALNYDPNSAPELFAGGPPDEKTDVYAAGVTLFRMCVLSGSTIVDDDYLEAWEASGRTVGLPSFIGFPRHVPRRLKAVIQKATEAAPADRYESAAAMLAAVERLRVALPWSKSGSDQWTARAKGVAHLAQVLPRGGQWELCYTVNGRRRNSDCSVHSTRVSAVKALEAMIAKTTLV